MARKFAGLAPSKALTPSPLLTPKALKIVEFETASGLYKGQYQLDDDIIWGTRSPYAVPNDFLVESFGVEEGELLSSDINLPDEDGTQFGVDTYGGMTLNWKVNLWKKGKPALDDLSKFQSAWKNAKKRNETGIVSTLRIAKQDRVRRVYGRPRQFVPAYGMIENGWAPIDLAFKCADSVFYNDEQEYMVMEQANAPTGGLRMPFTTPLRTSQRQPSHGTFEINGELPTWPVFLIQGPIKDPVVEILGKYRFELKMAIYSTSVLTIDPRPWYRMTLLDGITNKGGQFTASSVTLPEMQLEPGRYAVRFTGTDVTLSSKLTVGWRTAHSTP